MKKNEKLLNYLKDNNCNFIADKKLNKELHSNSFCIVIPNNKDELKKIIKFCNKENIKIVPCGGRTGLCGGTIAKKKEIVLSLEKLNQILHFDKTGLTITVQAGITLETIQDFVKNQNLFFPLDLASRGSAQIGGIISTNAGGLNFLRYGGAREVVLGIEAILSDGTVLNLNTQVKKNNSGYDLKQLFIGSEGTLGIITEATLKLMPIPRHRELLSLSLNSFENILEIFHIANKNSLTINAFEFFTLEALKNVLETFDGIQSPFNRKYKYYVLIDLDEERTKVEDFFASISQFTEEAYIPTSSEQRKNLWALRENINESCDRVGYVEKNDISVPLERLSFFISELEKITENSSFKTIFYGHVGDGNIHINYCSSLNKKEFLRGVRKVEKKVYELISSLGGTISAEHGIGLFKKKDLFYTRSSKEIDIMRLIKKNLDPKNILNPGKIFD